MKNVMKLEKKFNTNFRNYPYFSCNISELEPGFKNSLSGARPRFKKSKGYVVIHNDYIEIFKKSILGRNKGSRKFYFEDIISINLNDRVITVDTKSGSNVLNLTNVKNENFNLLSNVFDNYKKKTIHNNSVDKLLKYADLYERGLLTLEEFEAVKKELL